MSVVSGSARDLSVPEAVPGQGPATDAGESLHLVAEPDDLVEAAIDVLSVRHRVSREGAAELLDQACGDPGRPLDEVARDVVLIGLPSHSAQTQIELRPARSVGPVAAGEKATGTSPTQEQASGPSTAAPTAVAAMLLERLDDVTALPDVLRVISELAVQVVPGCEVAGAAVLSEGVPNEMVFTHEGVRHIDETHYRDSNGPSLQAAQRQQLVRIDDLELGPMGSWARAAVEAGFAGVMSVPVVTGTDTTVMLTLYTRRCDGWNQDSIAAAEALGLPAGRAIALVLRLIGSL